MNLPRFQRQRGTALVIAMLFLVILGMLGMTTMTATTLEERMAGNVRDRDIAMQAAEAVLRDAERDAATGGATAHVTVAAFQTSCALGLCTELGASPSIDDPLKSAFYGQFTGQTALQGLSQQPRYMMELLDALPPGPPPPPVVRNIRITAKGFGRNPNTVVILQTVYQVVF